GDAWHAPGFVLLDPESRARRRAAHPAPPARPCHSRRGRSTSRPARAHRTDRGLPQPPAPMGRDVSEPRLQPPLASIPARIASLADYEPCARERLTEGTWAWLASGAGDGLTTL